MRVKSRPLAFQWSIAWFLSREVGLADHLVDGPEAHGGHQLAHLLGDEEEVVDDVFGQALEALAQHRILRGDADRAGVEVALAHHDAAGGDQGRGREAELVGAEQRRDHHVASRAQAAVGLERDAAAQAVEHERLLRLGEADLPRGARMLERGQRRGTRAALEARDRDVVGARLGDACRHGADAHFRDELHRHVGRRVHVLQVEDRAAPDPRSNRCRGAAAARSGRRPASSGARGRSWRRPCGRAAGRLRRVSPCAILICIMSELTRYSVVTPKRPEATCLMAERLERPSAAGGSVRLLAAFAGVRLAADGVHGERQRLVRLREIEPKDMAPVEKRFTISRRARPRRAARARGRSPRRA